MDKNSFAAGKVVSAGDCVVHCGSKYDKIDASVTHARAGGAGCVTVYMDVTIYSTPTCGYCTLAKDFLQEKGIAYTDIDVSVDQKKAQEMVEKTGQMGVPVIVVNKDGQEEILVGFDQVQLTNLLGL